MNGLISVSDAPFRLILIAGFIVSFLSLSYGIFAIFYNLFAIFGGKVLKCNGLRSIGNSYHAVISPYFKTVLMKHPVL